MKQLVYSSLLIAIITLALLAGVNYVLLHVMASAKNGAEKAASTRGKYRYRLPNYDAIPWAQKHFEEFATLESQYKAYIGWRRKSFKGETITIDEQGFRVTPQVVDRSSAIKSIVWFFGGSTMWGTGANDSNTIPAFVNRLDSQYCTFNFGESGYRSRQELALLINLIHTSPNLPQHVIFYDGVNDVYASVVHKAMGMTHQYERRLRNLQSKLKKKSHQLTSLKKKELASWTSFTLKILEQHFIKGIKQFINQYIHKNKRPINHNEAPKNIKSLEVLFQPCPLSDEQLSLIQAGVEEQIYVYKVAKLVCDAFGIQFHAVLQPSAWVGTPNVTYLTEALSARPDCLASLYQEYYALLKKEAHGLPFFIDLSHSFDSSEVLYIDDCHVSPCGNEIMATKMIHQLLKPSTHERETF